MDMTKSLTAAQKERNVTPACAICEDEGKVEVRIEMPGVDKKDIDIKIEGNELVIVGKRAEGNPEGKYLLRERRSGDFRKTFTVDESIDHDHVDGALSNGLLTLTLKVKEAALPRKIAIA
jgi:HSP20 family protein